MMTITAYRNFDLLIARAGNQYRAFVVNAPAGEASVLFDAPLAPEALGYLRGLGRGASRQLGAAGEPGPAASLSDLGSLLYTTVFRDKVQTLLATSLSSVAQEGEGLRLRLRFEEDAADLALLPWETLYDPVQSHFVGLGEQSPILRYLSLPRSRSALLVEPPLRVLALLSSPAGLAKLDMEREWRAIQDALAGLAAGGKVVLERLASPTLDALQQRLLGDPVHVLHFVGHGVFDPSSQAGSLALEDARGRPYLVPGEDLAKLLRNHPALRLAYLNACEGALASGGSVFTGVAQTLVREGLPAAVAMQAEITDAAAIDLARVFYTALAAGRPVDAALTQARVALSAAGSAEWALPVLFSRSPDNRLFDIRQVLPTPDCPYPGMAPFEEAQQNLFFGRDREVEDAVERLRLQPFLTIVGPSGSGKSSLVYAGIIPALRKTHRFGPGGLDVKMMRPGWQPLATLAGTLGCAPEDLASVGLAGRTLLVVDQFEELFTTADPGTVQGFLDALQGLIGRPNLAILLTVRADFYSDLMASSLWQPIRANRLELQPLGDDALWAAIVEPAAQVGVTVDGALAVRLIADAAGERGALPLVQETLVLLWDKVASRELRLDAYRGMADGNRSGLQVAIDRRASLVYDNLPEPARPTARRIFLRLVQFGEGRADTRRQQTEAELAASCDDQALFDQTLARLVDSRLLTASGDVEGAARRVDIAHEALITGWPRLQGWVSERRTAEQTRRRLEAKAAEWVVAQRRGGLLDEYELQEAEHWLAAADALELGTSRELAELVQVSKAAIEQATAEKEAQRRRELEQAQKLADEQRLRAEEGEHAARGMQRRFRLAVAAAAIAVILLGVAGLAIWQAIVAQERATVQASEAERQRGSALAAQATAEANVAEADRQRKLAEQRQLEAEARSLAGQAERLRQGDPALAFLLADQAAQQSQRAEETAPVEVESALYRLLAAPYVQLLRDISAHDAHVWSIALWPDETKFVTAGCDLRLSTGACQSGQARIWDSRGTLLAEFAGRPNDVSLVAVSPKGERILTADDKGVVQLWDSESLSVTATLTGYTGTLRSAVFSPDGGRILAVGEREPARLWTSEGQLLATLGTDADRTYSAVFSSDGSRIATAHCTALAANEACLSGYARLWDADGKVLAAFAQGPGVRWVSFGPGGILVTAECAELTNGRCVEDVVRVWDPTGQLLDTLSGKRFLDPLRYVAFNAAGTRILAHSSTEAALWTSAGQLLTSFDAPADYLFLSIRFSPNGDLFSVVGTGPDPLSFAGYSGRVEVWNSDGELLVTLPSRIRGVILASVFKRDNSQVLAGGLDGLLQIWDTRRVTGNLRGQLGGHSGFVRSVDFSPRGDRLVTAAEDGVRLWDAAGQLVAHLEARAAVVYAARFNREGTRFATLVCDAERAAGECAKAAMRVWDTDGRLVRDVAGYRFGGGFDFSPRNGHMVVASDGNTALVQDADGQTIAVLAGHTGPVNRTAYSEDGEFIGTSSDDGTVRVWSADGQPLLTLSGHTGATRGVRFSKSGDILTFGDDGSIRVWSKKGELLHVLDGHPGGVRFASFNREGTMILAESNEGPARLWNTHGEMIAMLGENAAWVDVAAFDPAGERIMTVECNAVNDGDWCTRHSVNIWNARGELIATVDDHWVEWAAFHPDGGQIATAGCDLFDPLTNTQCLRGGVWLWQDYSNVEASADEARTRAGRSLTSAECQQYLGQEQCP